MSLLRRMERKRCFGADNQKPITLPPFQYFYCDNRHKKSHKPRGCGIFADNIYLFENWGARRAALRPYYWSVITQKPCYYAVFKGCLKMLTPALTPKFQSENIVKRFRLILYSEITFIQRATIKQNKPYLLLHLQQMKEFWDRCT